jgi:formylglycine-generating enzyme required for sulfatase activity
LFYTSGRVEDNEDMEDINSRGSRVLRGASFDNHALILRCAYRLSFRPANRLSLVGLRVARTYP